MVGLTQTLAAPKQVSKSHKGAGFAAFDSSLMEKPFKPVYKIMELLFSENMNNYNIHQTENKI